MLDSIRNYFSTLADRFGQGWNRFWFRPSDPYTLGLVRLLVGLIAVYWYLSFWPDLERFFGPGGLLPVEMVQTWRRAQDFSWRGFSYFDYLTTTGDLWAGYIVGLAILMSFAAGVFTRVTSILAVIVVLSLVQRGPMLATQIDDVLAMVMLYLCIGPCGASFSIDQWLRRLKGPSQSIAAAPAPDAGWSTAATISTRLLQLHLTAVYFMMAVAKLKVVFWWSGTAVWWIAAAPEQRLIDLSWLREHVYLLNLWTHAIVAFEIVFALLIWKPLARPLLLGLSAPVWLGMAVVTDMYAFCLLMLAANVIFMAPSAARSFFSSCCRREARVATPSAPLAV